METGIKRVKFGQIGEEQKRGVFGTFVVKNWKPWTDYEECISEEAKLTNCPIILMIERWDSLFGFVGGFLGDKNENEDLEECLRREMQEEIGYTNMEGFVPVVSHNYSDKLSAHLFAKEISFEEYEEIVANIPKAQHYSQEVFGSVKIPVYVGARGAGLTNFLKHSFPTTVLEEIVAVIEHFDLMPNEILRNCIEEAKLKHPKDPTKTLVYEDLVK